MVSAKELEDIKKLPPKERLRRLEQLKQKEEQERRKQEDEAKRIITESLKEIKLDEMLREIEVPKDEVDVNKIFEQQALDIEEQVRNEQLKKEQIIIDESAGEDYGKRIQQLLPQNTLQEIQQWYAQDNQPPTRGEFLEVYEHAREAYAVLQQSMQAAPDQQLYSTPSEQLVENVVSSMQILRTMGYKQKWFDPGGAP
jgi:hypothetical protein